MLQAMNEYVQHPDASRDCPNCGNVVRGERSPRIDLRLPVPDVLRQLAAPHEYVYLCRHCGFTTYWNNEEEQE
jgi:predicted RNA-binding Zn-ribbon protein involved in translation (DUF1610 family)